MQYNDFFKSDIAKLFYIYLISSVFLLLNFQGIYWDDWTVNNVDNASMMNQFRMNGGLLAGYMHSILLSIGNGIFIYRLLVFITFFLTGVYIYKIMSKSLIFSKETSFWISLIYLTLPLNSAKIALINAPATFLLFAFFGAFHLLTKYVLEGKSIWHRLTILALFFSSFVLNSLLVFYAIVLLYLLYFVFKKEWNGNIIYILKQFIVKYWDFVILPILFFVFKSIYLVPTGLYASYNKVAFSFEKILGVIKTSLITSIYEPIWFAVLTAVNYWYISIVVFMILLIIVKNESIKIIELRQSTVLIVLGSLFYLLAVFPYAVVNKLPQLNGWESRHQILIPLGLAFIIYAIVSYIFRVNEKLLKTVLVSVVTIFVMQNMYDGYKYLKDWYYQVALEETFKHSTIIKNNTTFVVDVQLGNALAKHRNLSLYEQNGRMKKVFKIDSRLMVNSMDHIEMYKKYKDYKQYNFSQWTYENPVYLIIRKNDTIESENLNLFKMLYFQFIDEQKFRKMSKSLINIEVKDNV